jgi:transcriptional regulator with XRE-family HTH domain
MLGESLQNARMTAGLSQETVATKADVNRSYLSLIEGNHKSPTVKVLLRICQAIGVPAAAIIAEVEGESKSKPRSRKRIKE